MSDFLRLVIIFLAVINPAGALVVWTRLARDFAGSARRPASGAAILLAFALFWLAVLLGPEVLDFFDISDPSFEIATGLLLVVGAIALIIRIDPFAVELPEGAERPVVIAMFWLTIRLANPPAIAAAIWYGIDLGDADTLLAIAVTLGVAVGALILIPVVEETIDYIVAREAGRVLAMLSLIIGVSLIVGGILDV